MPTEIQIDGNCFLINGRLTYEGMAWRGKSIAGLSVSYTHLTLPTIYSV